MLIDDIGEFLQEQGVAVLGEDMFLGEKREEPSNLITIFPTGGFPQNLRIKDTKYTFQILVRSVSFISGYEKINNIFNLLDDGEQKLAVIPPSERKMIVKAMQPPFYLSKDENNRHEFAFNVSVLTSRD